MNCLRTWGEYITDGDGYGITQHKENKLAIIEKTGPDISAKELSTNRCKHGEDSGGSRLFDLLA